MILLVFKTTRKKSFQIIQRPDVGLRIVKRLEKQQKKKSYSAQLLTAAGRCKNAEGNVKTLEGCGVISKSPLRV